MHSFLLLFRKFYLSLNKCREDVPNSFLTPTADNCKATEYCGIVCEIDSMEADLENNHC